MPHTIAAVVALWKELTPEDRVGVVGTAGGLAVNPDGTAYAYSLARFLSSLHNAVSPQTAE